MDVFEILDGYTSGYGLCFVDLDDPNLTRVPKLSQTWYSAFLKGHTPPILKPKTLMALYKVTHHKYAIDELSENIHLETIEDSDQAGPQNGPYKH
ncbi:hypothetical protein V2J09_016369 [Rumex salicifolius]